MATITELLKSLQKPVEGPNLDNNSDTWRRIGARDSFPELGLNSSELDKFLREWADNNPYNNTSKSK